jgi:hypothetical protein
MPHNLTSIETELRKLSAAPLDESLLARLEECAAGDWTTLSPGEAHFEQQLRGTPPAKLPASLMASLEATLEAIPFPVEQKIVRFPKQKTAPRGNRGWWSAAAAVAITGALTAFFVPMGSKPAKVAGGPTPVPSPLSTSYANGLVPAGFNRGLSEASDQGVIWQSNDQPHRVVRVVYRDRVTMKDADGRTYQMEQPRVEYILMPEKTD